MVHLGPCLILSRLPLTDIAVPALRAGVCSRLSVGDGSWLTDCCSIIAGGAGDGGCELQS